MSNGRAILNLEAELVDASSDRYVYGPDYHIVLTINGHEVYRFPCTFPCTQVYSIEQGKISLAEVVADHISNLIGKGDESRG